MSRLNNNLRNPLNVLYLGGNAALDELSQILAQYPHQALRNNSWPEIDTECTADFVIAHTGDRILLKFNIFNDYFKSYKRPTNGAVHLDNCVEFFISFDASGGYYNIEFNCLGIGKVAYGHTKKGRAFVQESLIEKILTQTVSRRVDHQFDWEMVMSIPREVFSFHEIKSFAGISASANFYKCGDGLPNPHYLCWKKISSVNPDFHLPEYFGCIEFKGKKSDKQISP